MMEQPIGKIIGLVFMLLLLAAFLMIGIPLIFRIVASVLHGHHFLPHINFHLPTISGFIALMTLLIWVAAAAWVYADAQKRGMIGILWALLVFIGNFVGLLVYLIVRAGTEPGTAPLMNPKVCPDCKNPVKDDYKICPFCGAQLKKHCPSCEKPVEPAWKMCPYCGHTL